MSIQQVSRGLWDRIVALGSSRPFVDVGALAKSIPKIKLRTWIILVVITLFTLIASHGLRNQDKIKEFGAGAISSLLKPDTSHDQIIELEGVSLGEPFGNTSDLPLTQVISTIKSRYESIFAADEKKPAYAACSIDHTRYETINTGLTGALNTAGVVAIAINVHNSQAILPAQIISILESVHYLMQNKNKVYISVYESDSSDKSNAILSDFAAAVQSIGVNGIWITSSRMRNGEGRDRIVMLSEIRNHAIAPLMPYLLPQSKTKAADKSTLIVLNDVVTCPSDVLELVHQQRLQNADMVTGIDWGIADGQPRLYDLWVARVLSGSMVYQTYENSGIHIISPNNYVEDLLNSGAPDLHARLGQGRPVPVYCMWGGMAAFDAALFSKQHLRFRSSITSGWTGGSASGGLGDWGRLITDKYLESDCPGASECEYVCRDIWNLKHGDARMVLAPQARTAYTVDEWEALSHKVPRTIRHGRDGDGGDKIDWTNVKIPKTVECIPGRLPSGELVDCWAQERTRIDPSWSF